MQDLLLYKQEQEKAKATSDTPLILDESAWAALQSMQDIEVGLDKVGEEPCPDLTSLKASSETWQEMKKPVQQVLALVTSAVAGFTRAKQAVQKDMEAREKKEKARAEKAASALKKEAGRKTGTAGLAGQPGKKAKTDPDAGWAIRKVSLENHPTIMEPDTVGAADFSRPWVIHRAGVVQDLMNMSPAKLNFLIFKTGFARDVVPAEQRILKSAEAIRTHFIERMGPERRLMEAAAEEISNSILEVLFWAIRGGCERVSAVQNGLGALVAVASERANYNVLLVPPLVAS